MTGALFLVYNQSMLVKSVLGCNESYTHDNWVYNDVFVNFSRFYYIIDGEAYYKDSEQTVQFKKGYLYITPVNKKFSLWENAENKLLHTFAHIRTLPDINRFIEIEVVKNSPLSDAVELWRKHAKSNDTNLLANILQLIFSCLERQLTKPNSVAQMTKEYMDSITDFTISMSALCNKIGYTREHITRSFALAYHMTPKQYLTTRKMELALHSLCKGFSVKQTAEIHGYATPYSFSKAFKKHFGLSPEKHLKTIQHINTKPVKNSK